MGPFQMLGKVFKTIGVVVEVVDTTAQVANTAVKDIGTVATSHTNNMVLDTELDNQVRTLKRAKKLRKITAKVNADLANHKDEKAS